MRLDVERQLEARPRPSRLVEAAGAGASDPGVAHVGAAEADVGADQVGEGKMLDGAVGLDRIDAAVDDGGDALPVSDGDVVRLTEVDEDRLLAPVPIWLIAVEKVLMGVLQGLVAALFVLPIARLIMGPIPDLSMTHLGTVVLVTILGATAFSALGLLLSIGDQSGLAPPVPLVGIALTVIGGVIMAAGRS